jgi:putative intracellular protease/amidase
MKKLWAVTAERSVTYIVYAESEEDAVAVGERNASQAEMDTFSSGWDVRLVGQVKSLRQAESFADYDGSEVPYGEDMDRTVSEILKEKDCQETRQDDRQGRLFTEE